MTTYVLKFSLSLCTIIIFYKYIKLLLTKLSNAIAWKTNYKHDYPLFKIAGAIEFILMVLFHLIFLCILLRISHVSFADLGIFSIKPLFFLYGILLGFGVSGASLFLCQQVVFILNKIRLVKNRGFSLKTTRKKSHQDAKELLPVYFWSSLLLLQLSAQEIIFRGVFFHIFLPWGALTAVFSSTILFAIAQLILLPLELTSLFPIVGAMIIGFTHGYLYSEFSNIFPMIISYCVYFIFTIL